MAAPPPDATELPDEEETAPPAQPQSQPLLTGLPLPQPQPLPNPGTGMPQQSAAPPREVLEARIGEVLQQLAETGNAPALLRRPDVKSEAATIAAARECDDANTEDTRADAPAGTFRQVMQRASQEQPGSGHGGGGHPRDGDRREQATAREADATPVALPVSPSGVFGARMPDAPALRDRARDPDHQSDSASLGRRIGEAVERLMVGDGRNGNRQVRMDLKDDLLEGVSVTVQELDGRLQVDFACAVESSRLRLKSAAPGQARELASRLARDVLLRIHTGNESDEHLLEVAAQP